MASPASASTSAPLPLPLPLSLSPSRLLRRLPAPSSRLPPRRLALAPTRPGAVLLSSLSDAQEQQQQEEEEEEEDMVEVGYVSGAHGVRGDVLVAPRTDFPELRFATPGKRWLRARAAGKQQVKEFELVRGRAHTGKKSWIVSFYGINTLDEVRQIVGSAILVKAGDRPNMEEDEIYSLDLVGMRVIVKDTGKLVGTVAQVFNFGAGDLLQVMVGPAEDTVLQPNSENQDSTSSGEHVWIPFAEDIVPDIDMESREMWITPPKGLLELNSRSDKRSKKERRAMIPYETLMNHGEKEKHVFSNELNKGLEILRKSKAATALVTNGSDSDFVDAEFQRLLNSFRELMKVEQNRLSAPFIIVSPAGHVDSVRNCLVENDYFGLDTHKVWVLEEMDLPIISISSELNSKKILLKSPWEILQKPAGSGAIFSLLSSNKILDTLNEMGVEFVQICSLSNRPIIGHPLLFGAVSSRGVDVGITLCKTSNKTEDDFDLILSMNHVNRMCRDVTKLRFSAHPEQHVHLEHVDGQWVTVQPDAANSHRLNTDVTSVLNSCSPDQVCVLEIIE